MNMLDFRSLKDACRYQKEWRYQTLKEKKFSYKPTKYKNMLFYRVNHS